MPRLVAGLALAGRSVLVVIGILPHTEAPLATLDDEGPRRGLLFCHMAAAWGDDRRRAEETLYRHFDTDPVRGDLPGAVVWSGRAIALGLAAVAAAIADASRAAHKPPSI